MTVAVPHGASTRSALVFWSIAALFVVAFLLVRVAAQALLLTFAGVLFGTALRGLAAWVSAKLGCRVGWGLAGCLAIFVALCVAASFWIVPRVDAQIAELVDALTLAYDRVREQFSGSALGRKILSGTVPLEQQLGYFSRAAGIAASVVGLIGAQLFVVVVALYVAGSPAVYRRGLVRLVPPVRRQRADDVLDALATTLRRWMLGRIVSMTVVGLATTLGLWLGGIPLPVALGMLSGVLGFIPNIGALIAAIPAILLAFTVSPIHAIYVLVLYLVVNLADGYGLTPWIEKRAVATPAALVLTSQLVFGALWGVLGLALATPLVACLIVITRKLYVEDVLEKPPAAAADEPRQEC